jgi:hypothetical protein
MFVLSQYLLNASGMCKTQQILSYSIALGLIVYSSIYLYLLFYNNDYLSIFNKFIIYIVVVDLLLSAFYYFNLQEKEDTHKLSMGEEDGESDSDNDEESEVEYIGSEDDDEDDNEEKLDCDSQKYIDNLIAQARISDQSRMHAFMQDKAPEVFETQDQCDKDDQDDQDDQDDKDDKDDQEEDNTKDEVQVERSDVNKQIEDIIDEVVTKKKPKKAPKKKSPPPTPTPNA